VDELGGRHFYDSSLIVELRATSIRQGLR